jgi:hypothetical protein
VVMSHNGHCLAPDARRAWLRSDQSVDDDGQESGNAKAFGRSIETGGTSRRKEPATGMGKQSAYSFPPRMIAHCECGGLLNRAGRDRGW